VKKPQRDRVVRLLSDGATLREAALISQVPWPAFAREWNRCRKEHEAGAQSVGSRWYSLCQAERAAYRATLRSIAMSKAGTRASSDTLALLKHLESEPEPTADAGASLLEINVVNDPVARELATQLLEALARPGRA
jgi:hypothetical protein